MWTLLLVVMVTTGLPAVFHTALVQGKKPNEDILAEALIEGFILDVQTTTEHVQTEPASLSDKIIPTPAGPKQKATSLQRAAEMDLNLSTVPAPEEPTKGTGTEDARNPTNTFRFRRSFSSVAPSILFPEGSGSGSGSDTGILSENHESSEFTRRLINTEEAENVPNEADYEDLIAVEEEAQKQNLKSKGRMKSPLTQYHEQRLGTPASLIIFGSCVAVGAILCIFAAIATKEKCRGSRQSRNIPSEDYCKATTLPLPEKEQETVTLMSVANLKNTNTENTNVTCQDKREREYFM